MKILLQMALFLSLSVAAQAQIQVELKFKRLQYVAHEPVVAMVKVTNLAGRDIDLHDEKGQHWFGIEVNAGENHLLAPLIQDAPERPLQVEAGKTVTRKINLTATFPVHEVGVYHVRAHVYFPDLNQFFYSPAKVFHVADARPIWQKTVGIPDGMQDAGETRTYLLLTYRFPDHTSLYVRVENKNRGIVYATYSLGRVMAYDEPEMELDLANQLHVLHCAAPRSWAYSHIGLNGELLTHSTFMETKTRPRLRRRADGAIAVRGGRRDWPAVESARSSASKLSAPLPSVSVED